MRLKWRNKCISVVEVTFPPLLVLVMVGM